MLTTPFILLILGTLSLMAWFAIQRVADGQVALVRRLGRSHRVLTSGTHLVLPLIDQVDLRLDTIGRSVELKQHLVEAGRDWQIDGRVYYQILDARQAAPELEHLEETVTRELHRVLPDILPDHAEASSDVFNSMLKQSLNARLRVRGILVARTQIRAA
jgi:regulator of protease activity HflC (stomatin/prohibitin superfamily)